MEIHKLTSNTMQNVFCGFSPSLAFSLFNSHCLDIPTILAACPPYLKMLLKVVFFKI